MIRRLLWLGLALLLAACSGGPWRSLSDRVQTRQLLGRADALADVGDHAGARSLYQQVIQEFPAGTWTDRALFRLARLLVTPESPIRDYARAVHHFDRLLTEYPESAYAGEARAWREALGQLLAREQEVARIQQDVAQLKQIQSEREEDAIRIQQELERLRKRAVELEREATRAREALEQLKRIDTELEKKRP